MMLLKTNWITTVFGFLLIQLIQLIQARVPNILWIYVDDMND